MKGESLQNMHKILQTGQNLEILELLSLYIDLGFATEAFPLFHLKQLKIGENQGTGPQGNMPAEQFKNIIQNSQELEELAIANFFIYGGSALPH
jgi:hypothetical protein